jgi:hypothetical protein
MSDDEPSAGEVMAEVTGADMLDNAALHKAILRPNDRLGRGRWWRRDQG